MSDYPTGALKRHPEWPDEPILAMRTAFQDGQFPGWTSWIKVTPTGTEFISPESVADWVDVVVTDQP